MKTITLPLEEYQDLITYKENWEKGLMLCYVGSHAHYISEEDYKNKVEGWCEERREQLSKELCDARNQLRTVKDMRDTVVKEVQEAADKLSVNSRGYWGARLKHLMERMSWRR